MTPSLSDCDVHLLSVHDLPEHAWKNGGGSTRELVCRPPHAGFNDFDWRISIAQVSRDGDFSLFPGVDRHIMLIDGENMPLTDKETGSLHVLQPFEPHSFPGEAPIANTLPHGPTRDFNLMLRRGRAQGKLHAWLGDAGPGVLSAGFHLLYVAQGSGRIILAERDWALDTEQALTIDCSKDISVVWRPLCATAVLVHAVLAPTLD